MYSEDYPSSKTLLIVLVTGVLLAGIAPFLFTGYFFKTSIDFSTTGSIGDTIAGTTAPILSVIGSLLIFFSFRAQINANRIQRKQLAEAEKQSQFDLVYRLVNDIKTDINDFLYPIGHINAEKGLAGLSRFSSHITPEIISQRPVEFNAIFNIAFLTQHALILLEKMKLQQPEYNLLTAPLAITYQTKFLEPLARLSSVCEKYKQNVKEISKQEDIAIIDRINKLIEINSFLQTKLGKI